MTYTRRVEFAETDAAGMVHFSMFFRYMEEAEHAAWRAAGLNIWESGEGLSWPRIAAQCDFKSPLKFQDEFEVRSAIARHHAQHDHMVARAGAGRCHCRFGIGDGSVRAEECRRLYEVGTRSRAGNCLRAIHFQTDRAVIAIRTTITTLIPSATQRILQRDEAEADHEQIFDQAQDPVAERLRRGVGRHAGAGLGDMTARRDHAAQQARSTPCSVGDASPSDATAITAPPIGRISVWTESQIESTQGILSATNSIA